MMDADGNGVKISVPDGEATSGLFGDHDDNPANDIKTADGEIVDPGNLPVMYGRYADSWRVSDNESAFTYPETKTTSDYTDKTFPSSVTTLNDFSAAELQAASSTCTAASVNAGPALEDCMYDILVTGRHICRGGGRGAGRCRG
jgi:hypothetical protein